MTRAEFTIEAGLEVQANDLAFWERILKTEVYNQLASAVRQENERRELEGLWNTGYDVPRGGDLQGWVLNYENDWNPLKTA